MQTSNVSEQFRALEQSLLSLVGAGVTEDYDLLSLYLSCAHDVRRIGERFDRATASKKATRYKASRDNAEIRKRIAQKMGSPEYSNAVSKGSPVYFVFNDDLIKVGLSKSSSKKLYKKIVPLNDVKSICAYIAEEFEQFDIVNANELSQKSGYTEYKVQATLMALVFAGAIQQSGRGKYVLSEKYRSSFSVHALLEAIKSMPEHRELLEQYAAQERMQQ